MAAAGLEDVTRHSVHTLVFRSLKRSHDMFLSDQGSLPAIDSALVEMGRRFKARAFYSSSGIGGGSRSGRRPSDLKKGPQAIEFNVRVLVLSNG